MKKENRILAVNSLQLWQHQKDALKDIIDYIEGFESKAFLVKMPTGTGKTGVFSALCRVAAPDKNFIIITPSTALKFQILAEIKERFWTKIGVDSNSLAQKVIEALLPTDADSVIQAITDNSFIVVTTIQALQTVSVNSHVNFDYLRNNTDCIIFDEGHKEPAYTWGETVRSFKKPTVLFSATPYRNDYKVFNIDKTRFFSLEHSYCEQLNILRRIEIQKVETAVLNPVTFVNGLLSAINKVSGDLIAQGIENPKVIIRCESQSEIEKMVASLKKLKKRVAGIHQNFKDKDDLLSQVPDNSLQQNYDFFIHQFKLIEGIDNPDFCIVAIYAPFKSSRLLVQQVGRVLRNPSLKPDQKAYLFCTDEVKLKNEWRSYLEYDKMVDSRKKLFDITDVLRVNKEASTLYFDGAFRDLVDVSAISLCESIFFQKKLNAYFQDGTLDFQDLAAALLEEWSKRDYSILKHDVVGNNCLLILYIKYENSPLVRDGIFIEQTLGITMLRVDEKRVFYYDSMQNNPMRQIEELLPVTRETLVKLFKDKRNVNKIFLMNTDIGGRNVRSKELQAGAIEYTAPGLADHSFFAARLEGKVRDGNETKRRYIGFQNGRITDATGKRISFEDMNAWIDKIDGQLSANVNTAAIDNFMARFASRVDPPDSVRGAAILLDVEDELLESFSFGPDNQAVVFDDLCALVENDEFRLRINGMDFVFQLNYLADKKRFQLLCGELDEMLNSRFADEDGMLAYLNTNQSFRVVIKGNEYIYANKFFFRPGANLISKKRDLDIKQIFNPHACISKITSEKGNSATLPISGDLWHKDTLFGLIGRQAAGYGDAVLENLFGFKYLVCDDLNSEIGDFIALDPDGKRLVFIHAKASTATLSATVFQEVCGQATKNLDYLTPYFDKRPQANITKWGKPWTFAPIGTVNSRIITKNITANAFYAKYKEMISNPSTSREVWLVVGDMFDYNAFKKEINKSDITDVKPEIIQLVYLLRSTWNSVSSVGAQLKIFC